MKLNIAATVLATLASAEAMPLYFNQVPFLSDFFGQNLDDSLASPISRPLIETNALQDLITPENLEARANTVYKLANSSFDEFGHPTRVIGSPGHWATINYILEEMNKLHHFYDISVQEFNATQGKVHDYSILVDGHKPRNAFPMSLTPPTDGAVTAPLVAIDNFGCDLEDYPKNVTGTVALIKRGTCSFGQKSQTAHKAGAAVAIVYNNEPGMILGTLEPSGNANAPTLSLSKEDADKYLAEMSSGKPLLATVYINSEVNNIQTANVVAQSTHGDQDNVVMLGAHSDSVGAGPGLNDDGSGTMSLLEVAEQLTHFSLNNSVRFAWWSAEEEGLLGSDYYVSVLPDAEASKIRLFMDYDMMASPNYAFQVYDANNVDNPAGSEELKNLYIDYYVDKGLNYSMIPFDGRSDYVAFINNDIPGGGIATGAEVIKSASEAAKFGGIAGEAFDQCYHELCDDLTNLNYDAWIVNTKLIAHSVATYARSFENFPARSTEVKLEAEDTNKASQFKYHGSKLVI